MLHRKTWLVLSCVALVVATDKKLSQIIHGSRVDLTAAARTLLEQTVCVGPLDVRAHSMSGTSWPSGRISAWVRCEPHTKVKGHDVFAEAQCWSRDKRWTCEDSWLNVRFGGQNQPASVRLTDLDPEEANAVISYLSTLPPYSGGQLTAARVVKVWLMEQEGPDTIRVTAAGEYFDITRKRAGGAVVYEINSTGIIDY